MANEQERKADIGPSVDARRSDEVMEQEANYFAMCLLMPERFMIDEMKKIGPFDIENEKAIAKLANRFKVSAPIMTLRLGQLMKKGLF